MNFATMSDNDKISKSMRLSRLLGGLRVDLPPGSGEVRISGITADSRQARPGDLFIAVPGQSHDGRRFIPEAVSLGAAAVLTIPGKEPMSGTPMIFAADLKSVIPEVTNRFYDYPSGKIRVAGVTGTNGKTTTIHLIAAIFNSTGKKWGKIGTIGYDTGTRTLAAQNTTPGLVDIQKLLVEMIQNGVDGCAMEASSHALDQGRCDGIRFSSATFTNLTQDHLDYHKDMNEYFLSKAKLFDMAERSIVNIDDSYGRSLVKLIKDNKITYSYADKADLMCRALEGDTESSTLEFRYKDEKSRFRLPLPGLFNHFNAAAAAATALAYGLSLEAAAGGLSKAKAVPGRMQAVLMGQPFGVYVDYAHTPEALNSLLESIRSFKPKELHVVFGCGGDRDAKKRPLMAQAVSKYADHIYLTSDNPRTEDPEKIIKDTLSGIPDKKKCRVIDDRALAIRAAVSSAGEGDIVVIAGKGHEEYQIIGTVRRYFSDIEAARSELRKLGYDNND